MPLWMDRPAAAADMTAEAEVRYAHISHSDRPKVRRGEERREKGQSGYSINLKSILLLRLRLRKDGIQRGLLISSFDIRYDCVFP